MAKYILPLVLFCGVCTHRHISLFSIKKTTPEIQRGFLFGLVSDGSYTIAQARLRQRLVLARTVSSSSPGRRVTSMERT
jgi:hypothetical protein